jgi:hypothetical protein
MQLRHKAHAGVPIMALVERHRGHTLGHADNRPDQGIAADRYALRDTNAVS